MNLWNYPVEVIYINIFIYIYVCMQEEEMDGAAKLQDGSL